MGEGEEEEEVLPVEEGVSMLEKEGEVDVEGLEGLEVAVSDPEKEELSVTLTV